MKQYINSWGYINVDLLLSVVLLKFMIENIFTKLTKCTILQNDENCWISFECKFHVNFFTIFVCIVRANKFVCTL